MRVHGNSDGETNDENSLRVEEVYYPDKKD